jgi:photosystem II stability/assembly factor-like uncharacterized protein
MGPGHWLAAVAILGGCSGHSESRGSLDPDSPDPVMSLPGDAFTRPWAFYDALDPEHPFDAMLAIPGGFVAITHDPSPDAKAIPSRDNIALTSADGLTWQRHPLGETVHGRSLARGNGVIVAVGQRFGAGTRGTIVTSTDGGSNWTEQPGPDIGLMSVSFVEGQFWAFGEQGAFLTSRDGHSWEDHSRREYVQLNAIAFGLGRYVIVGNVSWLSSSDGRTFTEHRTICDDITQCPGVTPPGGSPPGALALFSLLFANGAFVTDGWVSNDGLHFTAAPGASGGGVFAHGLFLSVGREGPVAVSEDGRRWTTRTTAVATDDRTLSCADHTCIALPHGILVVPGPGDPAPLPRLAPLDASEKDSGASVSVKVGQRIRLSMENFTEGRYGTAVLSSTAVRFLYDGVIPVPPTPPSRGLQFYVLAADAPGQVELRIPHSGPTPEFRLTIAVSAR